jgi:hypothetical protein
MELRQLTSENERRVFAKYLAEARATRGLGFKETARSQLGGAHLAFGNLYALYEHEGDPPERMRAGFILHDLGALPQSYPKPDVSRFPSHAVLEGGELWSLSPGMGRVARNVGAAVAGLLQAKAILLYSILKPIDLTPSYAQLGFVNACEPVKWPYAETLDGGEIWVQPLILEGARLEAYVRAGFEYLFHVFGDRRALRFSVEFPARPEDRVMEAGNDAKAGFVASSISSPKMVANKMEPHRSKWRHGYEC